MNENNNWSIGVGRWVGVQVNIHAMLFLFIAFIFSVQWQFADSFRPDQMGTAMVTVAVLLASVIAHEIGHLYALSNLGGSTHRIILTPWGSNSEIEMPSTPWSQLIVSVAGPFVNFGIFLFSASLLMQTNMAQLSDLIHPLGPQRFDASTGAVSLFKIAAWVNFHLLAINLIPCFPFDGAQMVRSMLNLMKLNVPRTRSESAIMVLGNGVAMTIFGLSLFLLDYNRGPIRPVWFYVMIASIALYFASRYSFEKETQNSGDDYANQDWSFDHLAASAAFYGGGEDFHSHLDDPTGEEMISQSQWMTEKQEARLREIQEREYQEDRIADEILQKIHRGGQGIAGLSEDERAILNRVSDRLRRRRSSEQEIVGDT
jgi:Zn-dependent protease